MRLLYNFFSLTVLLSFCFILFTDNALLGYQQQGNKLVKQQIYSDQDRNSMERYTEEFELNSGVGLTMLVTKKLEEKTTKYQKIEVFDTVSFGRVMVIDGVTMLTQYDNFSYHEMISHVPLLVHPNPQRVLIVGGGDGGTLKEVLKHSTVIEAVLCDIDGGVIDSAKEFFPELAVGFNDPRSTIMVADAAEYIKDKTDYFDIIIIDSTDPAPGSPGEVLFSAGFYENLKKALKSDGIITAQSESLFYYREDIARWHARNKNMFKHAHYYFSLVPTYPSGTIGYTFCSNVYHPTDHIDLVRASQLKDLNYYNVDMHKASFVLPQFIKKMLTI